MFKRLLIIHALLISPLLVYNIVKWEKLKSLNQRREQLQSLTTKTLSFHQIEKSNEMTQSLYRNASTEYLYSEIESLSLTEPSEKIQFIESPVSEGPFYIEKDEGLAHPVQVDLKDLKSILKKVEGLPTESLAKPHLIFSEFSIKKNKGSENIFYDLNFKLIKREYL